MVSVQSVEYPVSRKRVVFRVLLRALLEGLVRDVQLHVVCARVPAVVCVPAARAALLVSALNSRLLARHVERAVLQRE